MTKRSFAAERAEGALETTPTINGEGEGGKESGKGKRCPIHKSNQSMNGKRTRLAGKRGQEQLQKRRLGGGHVGKEDRRGGPRVKRIPSAKLKNCEKKRRADTC